MAGEIYIADKATLDAVKQDTADILAKDINSYIDGTTMQFIPKSTISINATPTQFLNINGKGILRLTIESNGNYLSSLGLTLVIDGTTILSNTACSTLKTDYAYAGGSSTYVDCQHFLIQKLFGHFS